MTVAVVMAWAALAGNALAGGGCQGNGGVRGGQVRCQVTTGNQAYEGQALLQAGSDGAARVVAQGSNEPVCPDCAWQLVVSCDANTPTSPTDVLCGRATTVCANPGDLLYEVFFSSTGVNGPWERRGTTCIGPTTPVVSTAQIIAALPRMTQDSLGIPDPILAVQPSGNAIVNLPVIVHSSVPQVAPTPFFGVLGFTVTVTATPSSYDWSFSNGEQFSTSDPGRAYDGTPSATPGYYVASTFSGAGPAWARLGMTWSGTATIAGGPTVALPALTVLPVQVDFTVRSAQGQLVRG